MTCPVTGYKCLKKDCKQYNLRRNTCQLEHLRSCAFKMRSLATLINKVCDITEEGV